ncbi:hypothetical protein TrVGV298_001545 [Trichoderma virens]|nr:hypothetical protein TrVGV298_001545 [Trichoderma virens]
MDVLSSAYVGQGGSLFHNEDYDSSPPPCAELDYLDIHSQPGDMRYTQEANTSALAIEPSQPPAFLSLYHPTGGLTTTTQYPQDSTAFYQPVSQVFQGLDVRSRLNSNYNSTASSTGMAQAHHQQHRTAGLPHLTGQVSVISGGASAPPTIVANPKPTQLLCPSGGEDGSWPVSKQTLRNRRASAHVRPDIWLPPFILSPPGSSQAYQVYGLYMSISAVVADNDQQSIELVQHTPKRDKGPTSKPEKVLLAPKNSVPSHHVGMYNDATSASGARAVYQDGYGGGQGAIQPATEHTFERIQFKQATQNNGKRRAAQQYYHLMVELWADLGSQFGAQSADKYFKIAFRKSEKMIVRGRSPGHYQNEKRRSHSGGPGGFFWDDGRIRVIDRHWGIFASFRGPVYGTPRSHDVPSESTMSSEDDKVIGNTKSYLYYPGSIYDNSHSRPIEMFGTRSDQETSPTQSSPDTKVKSEYEITPRVFHPPLAETRRHPGPFEGKSTSGGYYPTILSSPTTSLTL